MTEESGQNPYASPESAGVSPSTSPSVLAVLVVILATILSSVCTFFCTCFGIGLMMIDALQGAAIVLAVLCGLLAASVTGSVVSRNLYRFFTPKPPESKNPLP